MSDVSGRVIGLRPNDDPTYKKHLAVLKACYDADIRELPKETAEYFGSKYTDISLAEEPLIVQLKTERSRPEMKDVWEISVEDIPQGVDRIRFIINYD